MTWHAIYHHAVADDLRALGDAEARIVLNVITKRIQSGEPNKLGRPLAGRLAGYRRIRTGSVRIVYRINAEAIKVLVIAVGKRRDAGVYAAAEVRV